MNKNKHSARKLVSSDEAKPSSRQHRDPCSDCPWRRDALPGWLGEMTAGEWIQAAHGEARIDCHTVIGPQCAGAAIYRANMCKKPRDPKVLRLPVDHQEVFSSPTEFCDHHEGD
jgi:hypothetical protein